MITIGTVGDEMRVWGQRMGSAGLFSAAMIFWFPTVQASAPDSLAMARQLTAGLHDAFDTGKPLKFTLTCDEPAMVNGKSCLQRVVAAVRVENIASARPIDLGARCLEKPGAERPDRCTQVAYRGGATARFAVTADGQVLGIDLRMPSP